MADIKALGLLGCGHMGGAILRGALSSGLISAGQIKIFDPRPQGLEDFFSQGVGQATTEAEIFSSCDLVLLAVKPQVFLASTAAWESFAKTYSGTLISIMAGISSAALNARFPRAQVVRTMPNLGLSVGQGAVGLEDGASESALAQAEALFAPSGKTVRVKAQQMDAVTGLSGSGPMYAFEFVEGLILGGVQAGLPRDAARRLALQTVKGALALLESSNEHPSEWTAKVCSPGGTTIQALLALESGGFKASLMQAVAAATRRSAELGA
jgi:pyrroline-5-carboxylate reductase